MNNENLLANEASKNSYGASQLITDILTSHDALSFARHLVSWIRLNGSVGEWRDGIGNTYMQNEIDYTPTCSIVMYYGSAHPLIVDILIKKQELYCYYHDYTSEMHGWVKSRPILLSQLLHFMIVMVDN